MEADAVAILVAKDAIRDLVLLYSRGVDRKDFALLRTLYARDATDLHDVTFEGPADAYVDFLERSLPHCPYSGHHVCNHLISVDPARGEGEGEVYALAYHVIPDGAGGWLEDMMAVRYVDRYRIEDDRWRFAARVVRYDMTARRPFVPHRDATDPSADPSYRLSGRLFARGDRA